MENLFYNISQVLGITIIHSLWQGLTIYVVLSLILQFLPDLAASSKYKLAFTAFGIMLGWFAYTLYFEVDNYTWISSIPNHGPLTVTAFVPVVMEQWQDPSDRYYAIIAHYLPYVTMAYLAGLVFNTLKMLLAFNNIYHIRKNVIASGLQQQVNQLMQQAGITKQVQAVFSNLISVPCITGFLRPIILLPYGISTYLTAQEIEAILLHELAHIKRNDYLVNLIQQAIGILLFFNPFSWLINRIINRERENSCDDMVVRTTGTPLVYAQALLKLEQNKQQQLQLALAATGKKYHLLHRIERIMKNTKTTVNIRPALIALILITCSLSSIAMFNPKIEQGKASVKALINAIADTTKKTKATATAKKAKKKTRVYQFDEKTVSDADMEKTANDISDAYEQSPRMKELQDKLEKKSAELDKLSNDPKIKELQARLDANGKKIEAYYNTPEYKKKQLAIEKAAEQLAKYKPGSDEYYKQLKNLMSTSMDFASMTSKPVINEQVALATKLAAEVMSHFNDPKVQGIIDSIKEEAMQYQDDPEVKKALHDKIKKINDETKESLKSEIKDARKAEKSAGKEKVAPPTPPKAAPAAPKSPEAEPVKPDAPAAKSDKAAAIKSATGKNYTNYSVVYSNPDDTSAKQTVAHKAGR